MASLHATFSNLLCLTIVSSLILITITMVHSSSVVEDLNNLLPPPDFNTTILNNCIKNPSLRYCTNYSSPFNLHEIFRFTIVASHLCNESNNPNCVESFAKIDLKSHPKIAPLYLSFNFFWKYCPLTILSIDLSNNSLKGNFPSDVLQCTQIHSLDLSHNNLYGDVPIPSFFSLGNLTILNLSYNHFSESTISDDAQFFKWFNSSSFIHSGLLPDHREYKIKAVILLVGFPLFVILTVSLFCWLCFRHPPDFLPGRKHKFTQKMLVEATNGFSKKNLVRKSEGVDIYKGELRDGSQVRIEIYRNNISRENHRKFIEECKVLVRLHQKNIVRVLGWCYNQRLRAIVSEWNNGENVEMWLSGSSPPWKQRLRILMGVVEAMSYLQNQWPEIWYDLRTSSLLLSEDGEPLISRFKIGDQSSSARKIYKFGVLVLEMVANRRPHDEFERGEADFIEWVRMHYQQNVQYVIDERIQKTTNLTGVATQAIELGLMCTLLSTGQQPSLAHIDNFIYRLNQVSTSPNHKRLHTDTDEGQRHV